MNVNWASHSEGMITHGRFLRVPLTEEYGEGNGSEEVASYLYFQS